MSLKNIIATTVYTTKLPSNGKKIVKFRPFLVKEEKVLLTALQSEDPTTIAEAIFSVMDACVLSEEVNVRKLAGLDLEYLFIQLRMKSVGEKVESQYRYNECPIKENGSCIQDIEIDLNQATVRVNKAHSKKIMLTDSIGLEMRYPTIELLETMKQGEMNNETVMKALARCIDRIFTPTEVYAADAETEEELIEFLDNLTSAQFNKIKEFFETMPQLYCKLNTKCRECGKDIQFEATGLKDFFV